MPDEIQTCVVGTKWKGQAALSAIARMKPGDDVRLEREPGNRFDANAVACHFHGCNVGYIPRQANGPIARAIDVGAIATAVVKAPAQVSTSGYIAREPVIIVQIREPQL